MCPESKYIDPRQALTCTGNPAVLGLTPLDRKLCVPTFRWVCLFSAISVRHQQMTFKHVFTEPVILLSSSSDTRTVKAGES